MVGNGALRALGQRNFRLFFLGQSVSLVGTWIQQLAAAWLVYRLSGSPLLLGVTSFAGQIPILFIAPFGGLLADRFDRRRTLLVTQTIAALQALVLALLTLTGSVRVEYVIIATACLGIVNGFDIPLRQAFLLEMVGSRELLPNAIALNSLLMNGSRLVGPPVAGLLLAAVGEGWCFLLNALSYGAIIAVLTAMRIAPQPPRQLASRWREELREAFHFVRDYLPSRKLLTLVALISLMANPYSSLLPVFARDILSGNAPTLGWLNGAASIGAVLGVGYLATRQGIRGLESMTAVAAALAGVGLIAFALSSHLGLSLALLPLVGFGILLTTASANTIQQTVVPDRLRGRIVSFHVSAFLGVAPLGHLLTGYLAEHFGARHALLAGGLGCIVAAAWFAASLPAVRRILKAKGHGVGDPTRADSGR